MAPFVIVVPESWLHQYAVSVRADCSVPASTVLSLGFPFLIIQLPFIYSLGISQSCKFGVNLYDVLNIAHLSFWIISSMPTAFLSFFKTLTVFFQPFPWCQRHSRQSFRQYLVTEWRKFSPCTFIVGVFLSLLGSKLSQVGRRRPTIFVVITIHTCPEVKFEPYLLTKCWCFIVSTILLQLYSLYSVMIFF